MLKRASRNSSPTHCSSQQQPTLLQPSTSLATRSNMPG